MGPIRRACKRKIETSIGDDLSLALPGTHVASASQPKDDDLYSDMFRVTELDVCRKKLEDEVNKTEAVEAELKRVSKLYDRYVDKTAKLEDKLLRRMALQDARDSAGGGKEEVGSSYDINTRNVGIMCRKCESVMANSVFFPCRHLCVCMGCYHKVKVCPICDAQRSTGFKVDVRIPN